MPDQFNTFLADVNASAINTNTHGNGRKAGAVVVAGLIAAGSFSVMNGESNNAEALSPVVTLAEANAMGLHADTFTRSTSSDSSTSSTEASTTTSEASTTTEAATTTTNGEAKTTSEAILTYIPAHVIGEKPCGPQVDAKEIEMRLADGQIVVKPSETADYLNNNPKMEQGFNDFYNALGNTEWIDFIKETLPVSPENLSILTDHDDAGTRALKARMIALESTDDLNVQNHGCDSETGKIFANDGPNGSYNHLPEGTQFWGFTLSAEQVKDMKDEKIELPEQLITFTEADGSMDIVMERATCNNPLLELPPPPPTTTVPESTTSTTIPESTTSTTTPETSTSTTTPDTTTSTTIEMPTTTTTQETTTSTTIPESTTTSTTIPESTTSTSTTTTAPEYTTTLPDKEPETPTGSSSVPTTIEMPDSGTDVPTTTIAETPTTTSPDGSTTTTIKLPDVTEPSGSTSSVAGF
ncbi:hypothetical protein BH10PAT3_BH10PAT3_2460 [soil metagenome]